MLIRLAFVLCCAVLCECARPEDALLAYVNAQRRSRCDALPLFASVSRVVSAAFAGGNMLDVEVELSGSAVFAARMSEQGKEDWKVYADVVPDPCGSAHSVVEHVNGLNLTWKAKLYPGLAFHMMPRRQLGGTTVKPTTTTAKKTTAPVTTAKKTTAPVTTAKMTTTARPTTTTQPPTTTPAPLVLPSDYDARDVLEGQPDCRAFEARDQGPVCGWCTAFATTNAFGARMCLKYGRNSSRTNTVFSAQQDGDCVIKNCADGAANRAGPDYYATPGTVIREEWCVPYLGADGVCGSACAQGGGYAAVPYSVKVVSWRMFEVELLLNGPGIVSMTAYNDFFGYGWGIYNISEGATVVGGHAMSLVGWGSENGVPYWLCQNSFGSSWGENGYVRLLRGADLGGVESNGLTVVSPAAPAHCPDSQCSPWSHTLSDCSCACGNLWSGPTCSECVAVCQNGGAITPQCTCACQAGFSGPQCQYGYSIGASCDGWANVTYTLQQAPAPGGVLFLCVENCGNQYVAAVKAVVCDAGCAESGTFTLQTPSMPGVYTVMYVEPVHDPQYGTYFPVATTQLGQYTVLPTGCGVVAAMQAAQRNYSLMAGRLAAVQIGVAITGFTGSVGWVLQGAQNIQLCYRLPGYTNAPNKAVNLVLGAAQYAIQTSPISDACVALSFPSGAYTLGVPATLDLVDADTNMVLLTTQPFVVASASFGYSGVSKNTTHVSCTVYWTWRVGGQPSVSDIVRVQVDGTEQVYDWFYTYCGCKAPPSASSAASATGTYKFAIQKALYKTTNTFPAFLYPSGGSRLPSTFVPPWSSLLA